MRLFIAAAILVTGLPTGSSSHGPVMLCEEQSTNVSDGAFIVQNDEWGSSASECVQSNGGADFSVAQSDIDQGGGTPGAYPSIFDGCHWGQCTASPLSDNPLRLSRLTPGYVTTSWSTVPSGSGIYDTAYDIWFNNESYANGAPDCAELMIWLNHNGPARPFGNVVARDVAIGGRSYDVWEGANSNWNTVSYEMTTPVSSVRNLDVVSIADDAAERGFIPSSCYLLDIEAGFELWQDGTGLATTGFSVNYGKPTPPASPSPSPSAPAPAPSVSPSPSAPAPSVSPSPSESPSASPSRSVPPSPSGSPTSSPAPSGSPMPSAKPSRTASPPPASVASPASSAPSARPSRSALASPSVAPSPAASPRPSASRTPRPAASALPAAPRAGATPCIAKFTVVSAWSGGFWGQITISGVAVDPRRSTLEWALPGAEQITELWDGVLSQHGARVAATHLTVGKHGSVSVGFIAISPATGSPAPAHIALDGAGCR